MNNTISEVEMLVKDIMETGFNTAMMGDPFKSEEENEKLREQEYDFDVGIASAKVQKLIDQAIQNTTAEMVYRIRQVLCSEDVLSLSVEKALEEMMEEVQGE